MMKIDPKAIRWDEPAAVDPNSIQWDAESIQWDDETPGIMDTAKQVAGGAADFVGDAMNRARGSLVEGIGGTVEGVERMLDPYTRPMEAAFDAVTEIDSDQVRATMANAYGVSPEVFDRLSESTKSAMYDRLPEDKKQAISNVVLGGMGRRYGIEMDRFDPSGVSTWLRESGEDIKSDISETGKAAINGSQVSGSILDPSSIEFGDNPSAAGFVLQGADVLGQMAPTALTAYLTRGQSLATQAGASGAIAAAQTGGFAGAEEQRRVMDMPDEAIAQIPEFAKLINSGMDPESARVKLADMAGRGAFNLAAPVGALSGLLLSGITNKAGQGVLAKVFGGSKVGRFAGGTIAESAGEGTQEVLEGMAQRGGAAMETGETRDIMEGTAGEFVMGAMSGPAGGFGAAIGPDPTIKPGGVTDRVFGGPGIQAGDVLGDVGNDSAPIKAEKGPMTPGGRGYTFDESGNVIEERAGLALPPPEPVPPAPGTDIGPAGPREGADPVDFIVDPEGGPSAPGDWRARAEARRARTGGPGMGPAVDGEPTMAPDDMAQAAFDTAMETATSAMGRAPSKSSASALASRIAERFGVDPAALIERNRNPVRTGRVPTHGVVGGEDGGAIIGRELLIADKRGRRRVKYTRRDDGRIDRKIIYDDGEVFYDFLVTDKNGDEQWVSSDGYNSGEFYPVTLSPDEAEKIAAEDAQSIGFVNNNGRAFDQAPAAAVAPASPAVEPAPPAEVPRGRMFRQGNNAEAVQAPNGTWYTRRRVAGRWQPWQRRRSFDPSGAHGYSPYQPPSGNVRTPAGVIRVGDDRREAKPTGPRPPNDVIQVIAAAGGINREAARRAGVDPAMLQRRVGIRPLFPINGGMPLNGMRELLTSEGFFPPDDPDAPPTVSDDDAFEIFNRALQGERIVSPNRAAEEAAYQESQRSAGTAQAEDTQPTAETQTDDDERLAAEFLSRVESDPVARRVFDDLSAEEDAEAMAIVDLAERAMQLGATPAEVRQAYNAQGDADLARNLWELIRTKEIANGPDAREGQARDRNGDQAQPGGLEAARDAAQRQPAAGNEGASASRPVESVGQAESEEVTRLRGEVSRLQRELDTDSLTGVKSRAAYSRDNPKAKGVAFIDVIAFKGYNTKFTETGGDAVLQAFGRVMLEVAGEQAYRRGGDEFAILSSESPEHAREIAKRVFDAMAQERLLLVDKEGVEYEIAGIPFRTGIGATDAEATADSAARKLASDRESNPNVQRRASDADVGRSGAVPGPDVRGQGGVPGQQEDSGLTNEPQSDDQAGGRDGQGASAAVERGEATVRGADPGRGERPAESAGAWNPGNDRGVRNDGLAQAGPERADAAPVVPRRNDDTPADPLALSDETAVTPPPAAPRPPSQNGLFGQVTPMDVDRLNYERAQSEARTDPSRAPRPPASDTVDIEQQIAREAHAAPRPQNTIFTEDAAARAREILRRNLGRTSNMLDPEVVQAGLTLAGYHIEAGARRFADFVRAMVADLGEEVRPYLKSWYMAAKYDPRVSASPFASELSGAAEVESANVEAIGADDVSSANINLERDRGNTVDQASAVEAAVPNVERPASSGTGSDRESSGARGRRRARSSRVSADGSAVDGDGGNLALFGGERVDQPALVPSGADNDQRGGGFGDTGIPVESAAASEAARPTDQGAPEFRKRAEQRAADGVAIKVGNLANIRETLPYLLPGQQEDVYKAEQRFAKPDGYGMLFTNGTGTGKTFTGLGIVKRFARQGKTNTIIVAPSDKIIEDWINSGKALGLNITRLDGTNDAGNGIVITTYAAFGANRILADREWDLVVADEAHYLAQDKDGTPTTFLRTLRAITLHSDGAYDRARMIHRDLVDRASAAADRAKLGRMSDDERNWSGAGTDQEESDRLYKELRAKTDEMREYVASRQGIGRTRATFLSATPFAYEKAIDWANGYLFDYNEGQESDAGRMGYNSGDNRERFFMLNFGYRMRYNKLTQPDANVDTGVMQRQFNAKLKRDGSLSSRILDVAADYDRKFILTESAIGARIDAALQWIRDHDSDKAYDLQKLISDRFDHLSRRYLLEAIKAEEVIPLIREHMALGRKVVVFHDYKKGGGFNPFDIPHTNDRLLDSLIDEFRAEFRDLVNYPFQSMPSPIIAFQREFPGVLLFNGDVSPKDRRANVAKFNDDASGPQVILVQSAAGKEGISLHDTTGKHQRVLFNLGLPTQPTTAIQQEGRIYRTGQVTNALFRYLNTGTNWERWAFATTIATRSSTAENLALGEQARALRDAFIAGFEESDNYRAGDEGEGIGGKERDRAANEALTEFDRARSFYFGTQKKNSRTKAQEGTDYFATPEPLGLKMVEWADIRPGETALEPSAGHGAIARWFPETNKVTAIEPSSELAARLAMVRGDQNTRIEQARFEDHNIVNKYDVIVMNPPFGSGGRTAIDHLDKAARHLRDGGRIVALIPTGPAADAKFQKWFFDTTERPINPLVTHPVHGPIYKGDTITTKYMPGDLVVALSDGPQYVHADKGSVRTLFPLDQVTSVKPTGKRVRVMAGAAGLHLTADIELPAVTFERAGTQVRTRILVIDKIDGTANPGQSSRDYTDATTIKDFFDRIEHSSIPSRMKARPAEEATPEPTPAAARGAAKSDAKAAKQAAAAAGEQAAAAAGEPIVEHVTQNGKTLRGVVRSISQVEAKALDAYTFRKNGGFFIRLENLAPKDGDSLEVREDQAQYSGHAADVPNAVREDRAKAGRGRVRGDIQPAAGVPAQLDIFDAVAEQPRPGIRERAELRRKAVDVRTGELRTGITRVATLADAAHIFAPLRKSPVEQFMVLVLDSFGKPLRVLRHTIGTRDGASVYPDVIVPQITAVRGAASVVFAHNHPSGNTEESTADIAITRRLKSELDGLGVTMIGHVIVAPNARIARVINEDGLSRAETITPARRSETIGISEQQFRKISAVSDGLSDPAATIRYIRDWGKTGVILLDTRHRVVGQIPMSDEEMASLRSLDYDGEIRARNVLAAASEGAASAFIVSASSRKAGQNIGGLLRRAGRVIDVIVNDGGDYQSLARSGEIAGGNSFVSNPPSGWESVETDADRLSNEAIEREVEKARAEFGDAVTIEVMDSINDSPASDRTKKLYPGANGLTDGKSRVWIFRRGLQSLQALRTTLAHEIIGHIGVERVIGADWPAVMDAIKRIREGKLFASPAVVNAIRSAESRYPGADDLTFAREAVAIMAERGITGALWDRIVAAVRRYLRKVFGSLQWSESEVRDLLRRAGEAARKPAVIKGSEFEAAQVVFHGTPHKVDRFRMDKIGTGEGAQAYGWGAYFASKREVAEHYKRSIRNNFDGLVNIAKNAGMNHEGASALAEIYQKNMPFDDFERIILSSGASPAIESFRERIRPQLNSAYAAYSEFKREGNLYQVEVPEDSDLLDWDKPLSEQPEKVRERLTYAVVKETEPSDSKWLATFNGETINGFNTKKAAQEWLDTAPFGDIYRAVSAGRGPSNTSTMFAGLGIPGLRYLDGNSRGNGEGSHNYVIWDEAAIGEPTMASNPDGAITDTPEFKRWFKDSKVVNNALADMLAKPDGARILIDDLLAAQGASSTRLDPVQALMLALSKNDKIGGAIVGLVPVDVVDSLSKNGGGAKDARGDRAVLIDSLNAPVSGKVLASLRGVLTSLSAKLADAISTGRDVELAPALFASDLNLREVGGLLALHGGADFGRGSSGIESVGAGQAAKSSASSTGLPSVDSKLDAAGFADLLNKFMLLAPHAKNSIADNLPSAAIIAQQGKPLVVYHGTRHDFDSFRREGRRGQDRMHYFAADPGVASEYGGQIQYGSPNVMPVYLSLQKAYEFDADGAQWGSLPITLFPDEIRNLFDDRNVLRGREGSTPQIGFTDVNRAAQSAGYDGVIARNIIDGAGTYGDKTPTTVYVAFRPEQIKSVNNRGTFDPNDPSILASNPAQGPIERKMAEDARAGQPIDKLFRLPFHLFGLDSHGRLKPGTKLYDWLTRVVAEKMPAEDGAFGWAIPIIKSLRSGLIDRYGVPQDFVQRDERRESEVRSVLMHAARVAADLEGLTTAEAKVLQAMLTGQEMPVGELGKLSQPIKEAIDQMGREAVELGLISPEAYERNRGAYLHRSYLKYEADRTPLGKAIGNFLDKRRKKLLGDTLRRRGMTMERDTGALAAALGGSVREGDTVTVLRQKTEAGGVRTKYQRGPLNGPAPVGWENLGDWRVMGFDGKKAKLWRDFTPAEREKMGEILDARYNITKTFALMAHDLATGRFLRDIAANPDWARADLPEGATAAEARGRYDTYADSDWVRVPDAAIPGTNDGKGNPVKRWGALAGMYVRAPIWRDLNQLREMQNPQVWGSVWNKVLTFWKTNKTARNPVVHVNNVMSNMMFMDLADIRLRDLYRAIGAWRNGEANDDYRDAMANGAFGGGFADQELKRKVLQPILDDILAKQKTDSQDTAEDRLGVLHLLSTIWDGIKKVDGKMLDAYNAEDEIFRLAFYLRRQSLGDTPEEAARAARRQFIDYDIRAPWVNAARNTVLPFIGYTYRSIPILAQAIAERPWKLAKYATLAAAANWLGYLFAPGDEDDERKVMSPAVQGNTWTGTPRMIRMPWYDADGNPVFLDVRRWIPAGDVFDMNQSEIGLPSWLQFGGPLQIAGELMLNKQAFTKQPIVDPLTDTTGEKAAKLASWGWKAFAPNAPWIPESYSWDKIVQAITGETDELGRDFSGIEAASSVLGIKAAGMDVDLQRRYRAREFDRVERELDFDLTSLKREYQRKKISQPRFKAAVDRIYEKKRTLAEERRRVLSRTSKPKD